VLDLPAGFSYRIVSETGKPLTGVDGVLPNSFDGSGVFEIDGTRYLVRNSEQWLPADDESHNVGDGSLRAGATLEALVAATGAASSSTCPNTASPAPCSRRRGRRSPIRWRPKRRPASRSSRS
jgi:hypothetical protein